MMAVRKYNYKYFNVPTIPFTNKPYALKWPIWPVSSIDMHLSRDRLTRTVHCYFTFNSQISEDYKEFDGMHMRNESITNECPQAKGDMYTCVWLTKFLRCNEFSLGIGIQRPLNNYLGMKSSSKQFRGDNALWIEWDDWIESIAISIHHSRKWKITTPQAPININL